MWDFFVNYKYKDADTFDLAANETIVRCRSFFSCAGERAGNELALAAENKSNFYHVS